MLDECSYWGKLFCSFLVTVTIYCLYSVNKIATEFILLAIILINL